ncbi:hypothetical protein [Candidatus Thiosymbion oneisti]|uniref:hypothetical protein n=1 Tax=Candidatus Thiosymbion oneisti TaxID=589554 RepID=UPI00105FA43F|nr:hypothetical protein [Candidatus Thiosymbion oneisti]
MKRQGTGDEQRGEMYARYRDKIHKRDLSNTENYDKALLTLSSATLGFSLTAIHSIIPFKTSDYTWLIITGWVLLLVSIITSLAAFPVSNKALSVQLKSAEDYYIDGKEDAFRRKNTFENINKYLNYIAGLSFGIAIVAIMAFVILNVL